MTITPWFHDNRATVDKIVSTKARRASCHESFNELLYDARMNPAMANGISTRSATTARQALMRACAEALEAELEAALAALGGLPTYRELRPAQTGLVMLRGRIGGNGPAFNVGEATVTRAAVQLPSGTVGFAYRLGRSQRCAALAAVIDALGQDSAANRDRLDVALVAPVMARREADEARRRAESAATRVNFFTLVRGED